MNTAPLDRGSTILPKERGEHPGKDDVADKSSARNQPRQNVFPHWMLGLPKDLMVDGPCRATTSAANGSTDRNQHKRQAEPDVLIPLEFWLWCFRKRRWSVHFVLGDWSSLHIDRMLHDVSQSTFGSAEK